MRDTRYEGWFKDLHVEATYIDDVPISQIDRKASLQNQARLKTLDPDRVKDYAELMQQGIVFPAVIAWRNVKGYYELITGNHRVEAAIAAKKESVALYHVTTADNDLYMRDIMTRSANILEGQNLTKDERMFQAVFIVQNHGHSITEVAKRFGLGREQLQNEITHLRFDARAERLGTPMKEHSTVKGVVNQIQNDDVFRSVVQTIKSAGLTDTQSRDLAQNVIKEGNLEDQMAVVEVFRETPAYKQALVDSQGGKVHAVVSRQSRLLRTLETLDQLFTKYTTPQQLQLSNPVDIENFEKLWLKVSFAGNKVLRDAKRQIGSGSTTSGGAREDRAVAAAR